MPQGTTSPARCSFPSWTLPASSSMAPPSCPPRSRRWHQGCAGSDRGDKRIAFTELRPSRLYRNRSLRGGEDKSPKPGSGCNQSPPDVLFVCCLDDWRGIPNPKRRISQTGPATEVCGSHTLRYAKSAGAASANSAVHTHFIRKTAEMVTRFGA